LDSRKTTTLIAALIARASVAAWVLFALFASRASAQVAISLPDHGEYRIGQFMQVDLSVDEAARDRTITLSAPGALTTVVDLHGQSQAHVPMLILANEAGRVRWSIPGGASGELDIPLSPAASTDSSALGGALGGADAFAPTAGWNPGVSSRVRRVLILATVLIALLILGSVTLLRGRLAVAGVFSVVVIALVALQLARRAISPIWRAEGQIVVVNGATGDAQFDSWHYITTRVTSDASIEIPTGGMPVFVDVQHSRNVQALLHVDAARNILTLRCKLEPGMKVAMRQHHAARAASALPSTQPLARAVRSPMGELARRLYVDRDTRIVDEGSVQWTDDQLVHWASVILYRGR